MFIEFIIVLILTMSVCFIFDDIFIARKQGDINLWQTVFSFAVVFLAGATGVLMVVNS